MEPNKILVKNVFDKKKFQNEIKNNVLNIIYNNNKIIYETNKYIAIKKIYKLKKIFQTKKI